MDDLAEGPRVKPESNGCFRKAWMAGSGRLATFANVAVRPLTTKVQRSKYKLFDHFVGTRNH